MFLDYKYRLEYSIVLFNNIIYINKISSKKAKIALRRYVNML